MTDIYIEDLIAPNFDGLLTDVLDHKHSDYILKGGRGALKSSFVGFAIPLLMIQPGNEKMHAAVFRKTANTLRDSVYSQIQFGIDKLGLTDDFICRVSPMKIVRKSTGQTIIFRGLDKPTKLKSLKAPFGYFAISWFEEADTFSGIKEIRNVQQSVRRGGKTFWNFMSFNPPETRANFMNQEVLTPLPNRVVHSSDYRTVPPEWLGQQFIDDAEQLRLTNPKAYAHEYLGEVTGTGGEVFDNLVLEPIPDELVKEFDWIYMGVDWGFFPDAYAWNKMYYDAARMVLYIFDELTLYKKGNEESARILIEEKQVTNADLIIADSAEPKSISDYRMFGLHCRGVEKGPGSVAYRLKWLQRLNKIIIDPARCPDTVNEFQHYEYERTADGEVISGYPDKNNHHIDAVSYGLFPVWKRRGQ